MASLTRLTLHLIERSYQGVTEGERFRTMMRREVEEVEAEEAEEAEAEVVEEAEEEEEAEVVDTVALVGVVAVKAACIQEQGEPHQPQRQGVPRHRTTCGSSSFSH